MKKPAQVVMLPTNEKANIWLDNFGTGLYNCPTNATGVIFQHLYILSDEEIKEGDWVVKISDLYKGGGIVQQYSFIDTLFEDIIFKKIIATTDRFLKVFIHTTMAIDMDDCYESLPQPSQSFIEAYVKAYNEGNPITEVMVEYESIGAYANPKYDSDYQLKINSDNTINISIPKDSWSREEVKQLFDKWNDIVYKGYYIAKKDLETVLDYSDKWIEENL